MSTRNHLILSTGLLLVATALGSGCTQDSESAEQSADLQDSWLTHEQLVADLESDGYRADGRELVKLEYIESSGSSPSGYVCIADNGNWAFGRICYTVYRNISETVRVETWADRFVRDSDKGVAYALNRDLIGPFRLGETPVWGRWANQTEGAASPPDWRCDEWSSFNVNVLDFRAAEGFKVQVTVDGGRFPDPFPSDIEDDFFHEPRWLPMDEDDATSQRRAFRTSFESDDGSESGELAVELSTGGDIQLSLTKVRKRAEGQIAPWDQRRYEFRGVGGQQACGYVSCDEEGLRVDASEGWLGNTAKLTCGPVRTQSGYPAYLLPKRIGAACSAEEAMIVYIFGTESPSDNYSPGMGGRTHVTYGLASYRQTEAGPEIGEVSYHTGTFDYDGRPSQWMTRVKLPASTADDRVVGLAAAYSQYQEVESDWICTTGNDRWHCPTRRVRRFLWEEEQLLMVGKVPLALTEGIRFCSGDGRNFHTECSGSWSESQGAAFYGYSRATPSCAPIRLE